MSWLLVNIIPAAAIWGAMSGIPLWMVLKRPDQASAEPEPATARPRLRQADMALAASR